MERKTILTPYVTHGFSFQRICPPLSRPRRISLRSGLDLAHYPRHLSIQKHTFLVQKTECGSRGILTGGDVVLILVAVPLANHARPKYLTILVKVLDRRLDGG